MATNPNAFAPLALAQEAATGLAGFALQNATPTILTWTTPADGKIHRLFFVAQLVVTSLETGGQILLNFTDPSSVVRNRAQFPGGSAAGLFIPADEQMWLVAPNTTVTVTQNTALTAGAATLWAELWGI